MPRTTTDPAWWAGFRARFVLYDNDALWAALVVLLLLAHVGSRRQRG